MGARHRRRSGHRRGHGHGHPDHLGSAEHLRTSFGIPVWAHEAEEANVTGTEIEQVGERELLRRAWRPPVFTWVLDILRLRAASVERVRDLSTYGEQRLDVPGGPRTVHTPGHTSGHCACICPTGARCWSATR